MAEANVSDANSQFDNILHFSDLLFVNTAWTTLKYFYFN